MKNGEVVQHGDLTKTYPLPVAIRRVVWKVLITEIALPETNMAPENGWLEY